MPAELVVVAVFMLPHEAKLARALLESADITCYLENECTLDARWDLALAVGGFRLRVAPADLAAAEEILASRVSDAELEAQAGGGGGSAHDNG